MPDAGDEMPGGPAPQLARDPTRFFGEGIAMSDYASEFSIRRLWVIFGASMVIMFGALLYFGAQIYQSKPPMPGAVRTVSGQLLYSGADISRGQAVWQSTG